MSQDLAQSAGWPQPFLDNSSGREGIPANPAWFSQNLARTRHPVTVQLTVREVRATATHALRIAEPRQPVNEVTAFAQALLARYGGRWGQPARLNLRWLTRFQPNVVTVQPLYRQTQLTFAPRLRLAVVPYQTPTGVENRTAPVRLPSQVQPLYAGRPDLQAQPATVRREQLVQRLLVEKHRLEVVTTPTSGAREAGPYQTEPRPRRGSSLNGSALVVQRPVIITPDETPTAAKISANGYAPDTRPAGNRPAGPPPAGPVPPPLNVNKLTDQVIQAIDQRIIAQRERLGRV